MLAEGRTFITTTVLLSTISPGEMKTVTQLVSAIALDLESIVAFSGFYCSVWAIRMRTLVNLMFTLV